MNPTIAMSFQQLSAKVREAYLATRAEIQEKDAEIAALKTAGEVKDAEIAALKAQGGPAAVKALVDRHAEDTAAIANAKERAGHMRSLLNNVIADKAAAVARVAELEAKTAELSDKVAELEAHNSDLAADFDDMEQDNTELVASIRLLESIITADEEDLCQWKAAQAHVADRLAETEGYLQQADEMNAEKDAEIEELHARVAAPSQAPAQKKRRRGDGSTRREFTYDHVAVIDGKVKFQAPDAEHPATETKLRYVDVISAAGRSYSRYYVVKDGKEKMCRSMADVERAFGLQPTRTRSSQACQ